MPMTDAPNFVAKFGWRKPCPRYIGPLLRTASVASVGRGDHTLPPQILAQNLAGGSHTPGASRRQAAQPPVGGGLRPAPLEEVPSCANSRWFRNTTPYRVGADLCVRPDTPLRGPRHGPTRRSAPTDPIAPPIKPKTTGGGRALPLPVYRGALLRAPEGWAGHRRQGPRPGLLYASDRAVICLLPQKTLGARSRSQRAGQIQGVLFFHHQAGKSGSSGERVGVMSVRRRA